MSQVFVPGILQPFIDDVPMKGALAGHEDTTEVKPGVRAFVMDHIADVERVLQRAEEVGLTFSGAKSRFGVREIPLLGFRCGPYGKRVEEGKAQGLQAIGACKTVKEVRRFLGALGVYRDFIPHYEETAAPLYALLRKGVPWAWTADCGAAMEGLKEALMAAPTLKELDYGAGAEQIFLTVDAGPNAAGWVLSQGSGENRRPARFGAKTFNEAQRHTAGQRGSSTRCGRRSERSAGMCWVLTLSSRPIADPL
ncbi:MAG: hypothetical protein BJ554DRAFT_6473 [Olpidium bornovanus]|uniref:Reverse transcriptase/retrotransposon-derived protein RNase H-like domain-containing protein n=1 Tax=Olpidium bornovanus TaxID=278681 RepID=A0A8H7ZXR2_9FUNG|nr:MAG: hypothetical protein BJ554DRAFT_6473 [Olpidium bornovanus]